MPSLSSNKTARSELAEAIRRCRSAFLGIGLFSALINILMLTAPLFMLQVYDRVLPSHSVQTLVGLAILTAVLFAFQGLLDAIRGRVLLRIGGSISEDLSDRVYETLIRLPLRTIGQANGLQPIRDLDQIRSFLSGAGPAALFDLPWMPFYVGICFLFHPLIGLAALAGALILIALTLSSEFANSRACHCRGWLRCGAWRIAPSEPPQCRGLAGHGHGPSTSAALSNHQ